MNYVINMDSNDKELLKRRNQEKQVRFACSTKQSALLIHQITIGADLESSQSAAYQGPYFQLLSKVRPR